MANLNLKTRQLSGVERVKAEMREAATLVMQWLAVDEHGCNSVVASGKTFWREECAKRFDEIGVPCNTRIADGIFEWACHCVRQREYARNSPMSAQQIAKVALDHTQEIAPAITDEQVIDSLEIDSEGTADDARRALYGRDGSAETHLEKLKEAMKRRLREGDDPFQVKPEDVH